MAKPNSQTMVVRLPVEVAESLAKLRGEKNLATLGSALKYWVDEQIQEQRELEFSEIKQTVENTREDTIEAIKKIGKAFDGVLDVIKTRDKVLNLLCGDMHLILGGNNPFAKKLREFSKHPDKCPMRDCKGLIDLGERLGKRKGKIEEHIT